MTINEREFKKLCQDAHAKIENITERSERYSVLAEAVFPRLCAFLELDPARQQSELRGDSGFLVLQTLEEHMKPAFDCSAVLNAHV